jgi:hypothetical protein
VNGVRTQLGEISDNSFEKIESPDHIVEMGVFHAGGAHGIPRATTIIDEDICTCAAWSYNVMARHHVQNFYADGGMEASLQKHNDHSFVYRNVQDFKIPTVSAREFVTRSEWRWESETVLLQVVESCTGEQYPIRPGIMRGSVLELEKFERLDPVGGIPQTRVTWTQQADIVGLIPSWAVRGAAVDQMLYVRRVRSAERAPPPPSSSPPFLLPPPYPPPPPQVLEPDSQALR